MQTRETATRTPSERADLAARPEGPRHSPGVVTAVKEMLDALERSPTPCEQCERTPASIVHAPLTAAWVSCRSCALRYRQAGPTERRRMKQDRVMRGVR